MTTPRRLCLLLLLGCTQLAALCAEKDANPVPLRMPPPEYPEALRKANITGTVAVRLQIDDKGKVSDAEVVKSNEKRLEEYALKAVRTWTFKPRIKDGVAVPSSILVPLQFSLDN